ncbi:Actin cytoskeleton-regulatory complex protein pan1 [Ceratobasidium theobromae]|uniref:Actin cytoskeleton-regulatory complex protein pan1 n=1 Tax=Ceratobasidium theobromae TaxID=1582974 RepID=A0A5N5QJT9_9AGAM|nr:Actin cytoskeleton-regulatory complex protein pan1 [Ceratobasidium theobromae]
MVGGGVATLAGRGDLVRRNVPKIELVGRTRGEERLVRRGNATVAYLKYAVQTYNALTGIGPYSFLLSLDTASADTWVVSSTCRTSSCRGLPPYPEQLPSPSFASIANNHTRFAISFADGTIASGVIASETMNVGGFVLTGQAFGLVNDTNATLASGDQEASGVLGLGFPRLSQIGKAVPGAVPPVARLAQQGDLSYPIFGLSLRKNDAGTLSLGAIDADVVKNQSLIAWHDVAPFPTLPSDNSSIYLQWAIQMSGVAVNKTHVQINSTYPAIVGDKPLALLDLGTSGMFGPASDVARLFSLIPASRLVGDGQYAVPCDTTLSMSFTFGYGSRNYTLQPHDYIFARVSDPPNMCLAWPRATSPSSDGIDWQLGTPFLRSVYSVFSYGINTKEPPKIGLYPLTPDMVTDTETSISMTLSAESATIETTLPNYVLPTPTYTTPRYLFSPSPSPTTNSSFSSSSSSSSLLSSSGTASSTTSIPFVYSVPTPGQIVRTGLGASTYSALLIRPTPTPTSFPSAHAPVVIVTDSNGFKTTQPMPLQTAVLGGPGLNSGLRRVNLDEAVGCVFVGFRTSIGDYVLECPETPQIPTTATMASDPRTMATMAYDDDDDVSDTSSLDWTDLSSAHTDDVSDSASADGGERPAGVEAINDGSEEAWTTAEALSASSASVYASVHPLNPFESDGESERSVRASGYASRYGPLPVPEGHMQLILPDPLERSDSTVGLSFSDAVLAANPTAVVWLAGAHPSVAQRAMVMSDVLLAIAKATNSSLVRADYHNFTSLCDLPLSVTNSTIKSKEISVLVRDHTVDPLTLSLEATPSILVVFTSDAHESTVPSIHKHSILIPIVLSESRPVVLFDEKDDRPDETAVDMDELVRQLSNLFTFERDSLATTQTLVQEPDKPIDSAPLDSDTTQSLHSFDSAPLDETILPSPDLDKPRKSVARKRQPLDRLVGPDRADILRKLHANMGPGLTAACALAVVLSLVLGTGHFIQSSRPVPSPTKASTLAATVAVPSSTVHTLDPIAVAETSLSLKSPHSSLAVKSPHTSLAMKSPHTSLAVKSQHTSLAVKTSNTALAVKSQHTDLSVRAPVNESCSTVPVSAESTSLSTIPISSTSLSTVATTSTSSIASTSSTNPKARILNDVAEELGSAVERIERALGLNLRKTEAARKVFDSVRKSKDALCDDSVFDAVRRANEAIKAASGIDTAETIKSATDELHDRHQVARRTAQRQLASLKRGVNSLVWGEDAKEDVKGKGKAKDTKGKSKQDETSPKGRAKAKDTKSAARPGREKRHTAKDHKTFRSERIVKKDKIKQEQEAGKGKSGKAGEPERAKTAGRGKRSSRGDKPKPVEVEVEWSWDAEAEYEYSFGYGPRALMEDVREYFVL